MVDREPLRHSQKRELQQLQGYAWLWYVRVAAVLLGFFLAFWFLWPHPKANPSQNYLLQELSNSGIGNLVELADEYETLSVFMERYGISVERQLFRTTSRYLLSSLLTSIDPRSDKIGFWQIIFVGFVQGLMQIAFVLSISGKFWILALLYGIFKGTKSITIHRAADLLGQTGNGRLFYSGIRAALEGVDSEGRPALQVAGLASLNKAPLAKLESSEILKVLKKFSAVNEVNKSLIQVIEKYANFPAFVDCKGEVDGKLISGAVSDLSAALEAHKTLGEKESGGNRDGVDLSVEAALLAGVLPQDLALALGEISAAEVATMVLALQAGKILTYSYEGERWIVRSAFPHLNARAALHAESSYGVQYSAWQRTIIRQGLVFASRSSSFAPVRMPRDMALPARALRQWAELLLSAPKDRIAVAFEIELYGRLESAERSIRKAIFAAISSADSEFRKAVFLAPSGLLFVPLQAVLKLWEKDVALPLERLGVLIEKISQLEHEQRKLKESIERPFAQERLLWRSDKERRELAKEHGVTEKEIKLWLCIRAILAAHGWLGTRVGDCSVPPAALGVMAYHLGASSITHEVRFAMVAVRQAPIIEQLGKGILSGLKEVFNPSIAATRPELDGILAERERPELGAEGEMR